MCTESSIQISKCLPFSHTTLHSIIIILLLVWILDRIVIGGKPASREPTSLHIKSKCQYLLRTVLKSALEPVCRPYYNVQLLLRYTKCFLSQYEEVIYAN